MNVCHRRVIVHNSLLQVLEVNRMSQGRRHQREETPCPVLPGPLCVLTRARTVLQALSKNTPSYDTDFCNFLFSVAEIFFLFASFDNILSFSSHNTYF